MWNKRRVEFQVKRLTPSWRHACLPAAACCPPACSSSLPAATQHPKLHTHVLLHTPPTRSLCNSSPGRRLMLCSCCNACSWHTQRAKQNKPSRQPAAYATAHPSAAQWHAAGPCKRPPAPPLPRGALAGRRPTAPAWPAADRQREGPSRCGWEAVAEAGSEEPAAPAWPAAD